MNDNFKDSGTQSVSGLRKEIKTRHFFTFAFGAIIGIGWIMVLGEWLQLAGPLGAILGFAGGTLVIMAVGLCYAEMASLLPVSGGEVAYAYEVFGIRTSFLVGWFLILAYTAVTAFEAISIGWIIGTIFPGLKGAVLYSVGGYQIRLGSLILGLGGMALLTYLNYRGIKWAAIFQEIFTYGLIILSAVFILAGLIWGKTGNLEPLFSRSGTGPVLGGILAIFMTVPNWLAGFNIIPQTIEEKSPNASLRSAARMILLSIGIAGCYYMLVILSASMAGPWKDVVSMELPAAGAFEAAFHSPLMARIVLFAGLCGMITTWNPVFIGASRIIFALGRARIIPSAFGKIHPVFGTPLNSIFFVGMIGSLVALLGRSAILPIVNVVSSCFALAFFLTCMAAIKLRRIRPEQHRPYRIPGGQITAAIASLSCLFMLFLSLYQPYKAGGAFPKEWAFILGWALLGLLLWILGHKIRTAVSERERRILILGSDIFSNEIRGRTKESD